MFGEIRLHFGATRLRLVYLGCVWLGHRNKYICFYSYLF
jgi:hypothetical protein